jgi:hypothetical protein
MKKNHEQIELLIHKAINSCGSDSSLTDAKKYLSVALDSVRKVSAQRNKRHAANEKALIEGKKKHEAWWEMLKKNAKENFEDIEESNEH